MIGVAFRKSPGMPAIWHSAKKATLSYAGNCASDSREVPYTMNKRSKPQKKGNPQEPWQPELPDEFDNRLTELPEPIDDDADYTGFALADATFDEMAATGISFREIHFQQCAMARTTFHRPEFADIRLDSCSLASADWEKGSLSRIEINDCGMVGFRLFDATADDLLVRGSNCEMAYFWKTRFHRARFERCMLRRASFEGCDLSGIVFSECDLSGADFRGTKLAGTDFRGSRINGINVGILDLRGAIISPDQAAELVGLLGVVIKWDDE